MALNVCNWNDKQLDELTDMLMSADYSAVANFIAINFLATGPMIMTDDTDTTLVATVGVDTKTIVLSAGAFVHGSKVSQLDSNQTCNILDTATGTWGTGLVADGAQARWDIISVKNNEQAHTAADRWFVNDSVVPNTYAKASANTLINKAYYDIEVVHGTPGTPPTVPDAGAGYWTIAEIYIPAGAAAILPGNVYDTTGISNKGVKNWLDSGGSRLQRLEFWGTKFAVDHDPTTGYHKDGLWHIGATQVTASGTEVNQALDGIGPTVTATNLTTLTDGSTTNLHVHGGTSNVQSVYNAGTYVCTGSFALVTSMTISCTITATSNFLLFFQAVNNTNDGARIRFMKDGVLVGATYWESPDSPTDGFMFHEVSLAQPAGTYIFTIEAMRTGGGSSLSQNKLTVVVL